jgi:hypothetical protein
MIVAIFCIMKKRDQWQKLRKKLYSVMFKNNIVVTQTELEQIPRLVSL